MRILLFCLCLLTACGGDFDPGSRVTKLRLLAVQASPPWARAGSDVSLEALVHDPDGRAVTFGWSMCVDPEGGSVEDCVRAAPPLATGGPRRTVRIPPTATHTVGVVVVACPGVLEAGTTAGVPVRCTAGGRALGLAEFEIGVKRVFVSSETNENPSLTGLRFDDAFWPESLVPEVEPCTAEGNLFGDCEAWAHTISLDALRNDAEQTVVQYYASEGILEDEVRVGDSPATRWAARAQSAGRTVTLFVVARDSRGGSAWVTRRVRVRPRV